MTQDDQRYIPLDELVPSESKYLAKEDVGETGLDLTIKGFKREMVGQGEDSDERAVMGFEESVKPMVLNKTNVRRLKVIFNAETTKDVVGKRINVFSDPLIEFGGRIVGGIRIRQAQSAWTSRAEIDDDIPF